MNRWRECFFIVHSHCSRRARGSSTLSPIFLSLWTPIVQGYRMHRYLFIFSTDKWKGNFQWIFIPSYRFRLRICGFGWPIDVVYPHETPRRMNEWTAICICIACCLLLFSLFFVRLPEPFWNITFVYTMRRVFIDAEEKSLGVFAFVKWRDSFFCKHKSYWMSPAQRHACFCSLGQPALKRRWRPNNDESSLINLQNNFRT